MKRTLTLVAAALVLLPAVAVAGGAVEQAAASAPPPSQIFVTDFEDQDGRALWKAGGDATEAQTLDRATGDNGCGTAMAGAYGALRSYDHDVTRKTRGAEGARPDPVATWAESRLHIAGGGPVNVKVTWSARSVKDCEDCIPAAYVGTRPATQGGDFDFVGTLGKDWSQFQYEEQVRFDNEPGMSQDNLLYVALGWMGGNATIGLDCITITATRTQSTSSDPPPADGPAPTAGPATSADPPGGNYYYNFEDGLAPWTFGTDGTYGLLQQQYGENGCPDMRGNAFASISNIAGPTTSDLFDIEALMIPIPREPAMYMVAPFPAARGGASHIELDWMSKSIDDCEGCMQLAYVGASSKPKVGEFNLLTGGLGSEWEATHFEIDLKAEPASKLFVALGWQGPSEEEIGQPSNVGFDCVSVRINQPDN